MRRREIAAVAAILSAPENEGRTAEEVAALAISALEDVRARTHRLAVVGQIRFPGQGLHTVVLGPFSARGILDTPEKFRAATEGGTAARDAGQHLAWDIKSGTGEGRFLLAPALQRPRDAWQFFRPTEDLPDWWRVCRDPAAYAAISEAVRQWQPGLWARIGTKNGPACQCGLSEHYITGNAGYTRHGIPTGQCHAHGPDAP